MTQQSPSEILSSSTSVLAVGNKDVKNRQIARWITKGMKYGLVAGLSVAALQAFLPSDRDVDQPQYAAVQSPEALSSVGSDLSIVVAPPKTNQSELSSEGLSSLQEMSNLRRGEISVGVAQQIDEVVGELYPLSIPVFDDETVPQLAQKMWDAGHGFQALALQVEGLETKSYYIEGDRQQPTIGVGYNIQQSIGVIGEQGVQSELRQAGLSDEVIANLMSDEHRVTSQVEITKEQAVRLLDVATERFRDSTRSAIGGDVFDSLPAHRQASLMWIDYNSNIHDRPRLIQAVRQGRHLQAVEEMETWTTIHGERVKSHQTVVAQAMYWHASQYSIAALNPEKIKRDARNGIFPWGSQLADNSQSSVSEDQAGLDLSSAVTLSPNNFLQRVRQQREENVVPSNSISNRFGV